MPGKEAGKLLLWKGVAAIKRHCQKLPRLGSRTLYIGRGDRQFLASWTRRFGWRVLASRPWLVGLPAEWCHYDPGDASVPIPRRAHDPATLVPQDLPTTTVTLKKYPTLVAFLAARSYTDGPARVPGKLWLEGNSLGFTITLVDVDQALRCVVRAGTLDDAFAAAELLLGTENAPWEVDEFQAQRQAQKKSRKK